MTSIRTTFRFGFLIWVVIWLLTLAAFVYGSSLQNALVFSVTSLISIWVWNQLQAQRFEAALAALENPAHTIPTAPGMWGELLYSLHKRARFWRTQLEHSQRQEQNFVQAIQASPNAFVMLDDAARIEWVNQAAQNLLGLDAARDVGQNLAYLLRTPAVLGLLDSQRLREPVMVRTANKCVWVQAFPYGEAQTLLLGEDVTQLELTDQMRRDFVANVSHELRTPLTVLTGYTELIQDYLSANPNALPVPMRDAVGHIAMHTQRMNALTQDLLQLASLDTPKTQEIDQLVSVSAWFSRIQKTFSTSRPGNQAQLVFVTPPQALYLMGNESELDSALSNLVSNALRYSPATGSVSVSCDVKKNVCSISVQDTGCGVAPQHLPRLTERFYRVSASRSRDSGGTGLGLAIVKHIMLRHRGELTIRSELGKGSCFTLQFTRFEQSQGVE